MNENIMRMANMNMKKLLIVMSIPAILSMFVQALYNLVDSIFIARIGEKALTAVSLAFPVQLIMISITFGLGIGVNSYVSRKLGEKRYEQAASAAEHGIVLGIIVWLLLAVLDLLFMEKVFSAFTADELILKYSLQYTNIVVIGSLGMLLTVVLINIQQATGDMMSAMKIQLSGAVVNIILDPVMIFGLLGFPVLGVSGGALATVIGQFVSMGYAVYKMRHNPLELKLSKLHVNFKIDKGILQDVLKVGFPSMLIQGLGALMIASVNYILGEFSSLAVAAFGVNFKINAIIVMPVIGLTQGMLPVVGYNFGARNAGRVRNALKYSLIYAVIFMAVGGALLFILAREAMLIFTDMPELMETGVSCIRVMSLGLAFFAVTIIVNTAFQAFGIAKLSMYVSIMRQLVLLIPLAFILSRIFGVEGVWAAFPVTESMSLIFTISYALATYRKRVKPELERI